MAADINIVVGDLQCEDPVFTHVTYTGNRYEFDFGWTSIGEFLSTFDSTASMYLYMEIYHPSDPNYYYAGSLAIPIDLFNTNSYTINVLDYEPTYSTKDRIVFNLVLAGEDSCFNETFHEIPSDTIN